MAFSLFAIILVNIGGFKSVAWTDFLQGILMAIIAVVIFIAAFKAVGWSFADVNTQLSAIDPNLVQPFNESGLYSLSGVIAMPFYLFVSLVANPYCTIRLMAMTNVGRKSFKKFGLTLISVGMICMLMYMSGLFGRVLYPNLADADSVIPTIAQMQNPDLIPEKIKAKLSHTGLWDVDPVNLFRISWHNEAKEQGGLFQAVPNYVEIPSKLSGVPCRIIAMSGKWFPTGCHKVGASFGCLAPRLVTGQFDATYHHAVWPSTGNYCRGGAFNSKLLACESVAILPQDMSKERFDWLKSIAGQIIATPGCESNVKEIFDKTWELKKDPSMMIFNQFAEMGNPLWHYNVTGYALSELFEAVKKPGQTFAGACFTSGSAGTMSAGDLLKERYPHLKLAVGEALQCPTILDNGFGGHRIEGIGDKHIPWIHNVKNTDMAIAIDDEDSQRLLRLFNTPEGKTYMKDELGMSDEEVEKMAWLGISGIANVLCCIKMAKYYELTENDVVGTVLTDSAVMYQSRIDELNQLHGAYNAHEAAMDHARHMLDLKTDSMLELTYTERKRVHNLKYYTWVEQQGMNVEDLNAQWYDTKNTWDAVHAQAKELDELINEFNEATGLLKAL